ncbi:MAG: sulfatase-like hydrolase/transferase, partial [Pirellulaceae bacterium]|nr:sulfatase-like hydrolase/transferase [Pirellulaceae bacterium]
DISPHLGCYGDPHAITPHLDQLATEGVRYSHAFTAAGVCAPCRSTIITGMYQNSIGTHHMRCNSTLPEWLQPFPMRMQEAGYYCTNNSKTDYQFSKPSSKTIWDQSGSKAHWQNRPDDAKPFFAVFNFTGCHESGIENDAKYKSVTKDLTPDQRQDPAKLTTLPPYYPDTKIVREDWKRNYELITAMDAWAGELIDELKQAGLYEETIIFYWSDHGVGLPRAKRWLYDSGTRIPMIVRIPAAFRHAEQGHPGTVDSRLISSTDFGPTVLNLAGVPLPDRLQGRPFLGNDLPEPRRYVYGARDRMDERYDIIRSVRDSQFRYVRNFEPLKPYYQYMNTPEKGATMREIRRAEQTGELSPAMKLFSAATKPAEELYDCDADPHEINNLAQNPRYLDKLNEMRAALKDWQNEIGDIGLIPEAEIEIQEKLAGSRFEILNGGDDSAAKLQRLVDIATKASQGPTVIDDLIAGLNDSDPSVRYWAATGIGNIGSNANAARPAIVAALGDSSPSVRIAAARAAAKLGESDEAIEVLRKELKSKHQWGRLAAAIVLDEMDDLAKPAVADLQMALKDQPNKYIVRVANRALNELLGADHVVP